MKKILEKLLASLAKKILRKYKPRVIGITGSIGKTSAKEAIFSVLKDKFVVRQNIKNYNNELGVPLTIINVETGGHSLLKWFSVFVRAIKLILITEKKYPEILILEMGADKPGDISYLTEIASCNIGVLTKIGPTHLEFFGSIENVAKEKQKIITHLNKEDFAIVNFDDEWVRRVTVKTKANIISFGYSDDADVRAVDLSEQGSGMQLAGIQFKLVYKGSAVPVFLPGVVGAHQINSALAAAAVGLSLGMNLVEISDGLKNYHPPKGRMNLLEGIKNSLIIDDTYNSSPEAASAALLALKNLNINEVKNKVAILGDMLELGDISEQAHIELGREAVEAGVSLLVAVGKYRESTIAGAGEAGLENVLAIENSDLLQDKIVELINENSLILVKGSQGSRMEKVVKALLREPARASELLVRQTDDWQ